MKKVDLSDDEINVLLSSIGIVLNLEQDDPAARSQLEALQTKLMGVRDGAAP